MYKSHAARRRYEKTDQDQLIMTTVLAVVALHTIVGGMVFPIALESPRQPWRHRRPKIR